MTLFAQLIVAALATWQAVEVWHHSSLFASKRADYEARGGFLADLLGCPYCLSVWVGLAAAALLRLGPLDFAAPGSLGWLLVQHAVSTSLRFLELCVWALAVSRLANLGNDLAYPFCRTPRHNRLNVGEQIPFLEMESQELGDRSGECTDSTGSDV